MALKINKEIKGINCEYHKIHSLSVDDTNQNFVVRMASYPTKAVRDEDVQNYQEISVIPFKEIPEDVYNQIADLIYTLAKEPIMEAQDTGKIDEEGKPVIEDVDINQFSGATKV